MIFICAHLKSRFKGVPRSFLLKQKFCFHSVLLINMHCVPMFWQTCLINVLHQKTFAKLIFLKFEACVVYIPVFLACRFRLCLCAAFLGALRPSVDRSLNNVNPLAGIWNVTIITWSWPTLVYAHEKSKTGTHTLKKKQFHSATRGLKLCREANHGPVRNLHNCDVATFYAFYVSKHIWRVKWW